MGVESPMDITEDEAALYDRQIRLWGIDSQRKIRNAKVLIIGVKGLGAEVAKNIILAGVKAVTLLDDASVTVEESTAQFLVPSDALGQNRAEASVKRAQALNPMVSVTADPSNVSLKRDDYFSEFDVVVATCCPLQDQRRINAACRHKGVKFYCGDVFGMFGYIFADLLIHDFIEEVVVLGKEKTVKPVKKSCTYLPLIETLECEWNFTEKSLRKLDPSYFLLQALHEFMKREGRVPDRLKREKDIEKLKEISHSILGEHSIPLGKISESLLGSLFGEVSPVSAIVGGVLAQDIIKTVSQKGQPVDNYFFFNPEKCCGFIQKVGNFA